MRTASVIPVCVLMTKNVDVVSVVAEKRSSSCGQGTDVVAAGKEKPVLGKRYRLTCVVAGQIILPGPFLYILARA